MSSFLQRKASSGPPLDALAPNGTVRTDADGNFEAIPGTIAGQLWYWDGTLWLPTSSGPSDGDIPLWNATTNDWDFSAPVRLSELQYFDTTFSPIGLWNFNETLVDASGNGNDLTLGAGTQAFAQVAPGRFGLFVLTGSRYETAAPVPLLQVAGDITIQAILQQDGNAQFICAYQGPGETQPDNSLYVLLMAPVVSNAVIRPLQFISETGAGVNNTYTSANNASLGCIHNVLYVAVTRRSNIIRFYVNGKPFDVASGLQTAPDGGNGPNTRFFVGSNAGATATVASILFSLKIIARGLSDAEILSEYNRTMGPAFGRLS